MQTTLLPHLIRKDLIHVRLLFGLWLFLLLAQGCLIGSGFSTGAGNLVWQVVYTILAVGIPVLQMLVIVVLLPLLIQGEPLVGTTAFWFTRPASRLTVLTAKVIFVTGFLIIPPLVVEFLVFLANGIQPRDILRALPEVLYMSLATILPIAALCTLTRTFAKFALWLVIAWVALTVFGLVTQLGSMLLSMEAFLANSQNMSLIMSRSIASGICMMAGGAIVIGNQYATRRTRASIVILLTALAASIVVQMLWSHDFLKRPEPVLDPKLFSDNAVVINPKVESLFASDAVQFSLSREPRTSISSRLKFSDVPAGCILEISDMKSQLVFGDGTKLQSKKLLALPTLTDQWWGDALAHAIGGVPVVNGASSSGEIFAQIFDLDSTIYQQRKSEPGTLHATLTLKAKKLSETGRLPLLAGARIDDGSRHIEITTVVKQSSGCRLVMRERKVNLWASRNFQQFNPLTTNDGIYLLVNRQRNEAIMPDLKPDFDMISTMLQATTRLINRSFLLDFNGGRQDKEIVAVDAEWLAGAELVLVEAKAAGTLTRELNVANFLLSPKK